jgi:chorismate-pyruvate lyase
MPDAAIKTAPAAVDFAYPLSDFYAHAKQPMPSIETIPGDAVPEPFKTLLVHHNDMTPTLENFHDSRIHLEILRSDHRGGFYFREVALRLHHDEKPVEFGANKIFLAMFPEEAQELIRMEQIPLGRILKDCGIRHQTQARHFLRVQPDELIAGALELETPAALYGRKAVISDLKGRPLSEIVEILPPHTSS